jgi:anti-anti-sigma regulatory factor
VIETELMADSSIVCRPTSRLDRVSAVSLRHLIGDSIRPGVEVIIDLSGVDFIDGVGMSADARQ